MESAGRSAAKVDTVTETIAWIVLIAGMLLGTLGTIVPGLPGAVFLALGVVVFKFLIPAMFGWWVVWTVIALTLISWAIDAFSGVLGARLGGATKYGMMGAAIGGLAGIIFGLPGLLLGPFVGSIVGDLYGKRTEVVSLLRSGTGATLGFVVSFVARIVLLIVMVAIVFGALIF